MKKITLITFLIVVVYACSRKTMPLEQNKLSVVEEGPHPDALSEGRYVYQMKCGQCHELKNVADYTSQRWTEILQQMIPKAKLNAGEKQLVIEFIQAGAKG